MSEQHQRRSVSADRTGRLPRRYAQVRATPGPGLTRRDALVALGATGASAAIARQGWPTTQAVVAQEGIDIPAPKKAKQARTLKQFGFVREWIDVEHWPGPWCPHCTEEPVEHEGDLCDRCDAEVRKIAKRWRA